MKKPPEGGFGDTEINKLMQRKPLFMLFDLRVHCLFEACFQLISKIQAMASVLLAHQYRHSLLALFGIPYFGQQKS